MKNPTDRLAIIKTIRCLIIAAFGLFDRAVHQASACILEAVRLSDFFLAAYSDFSS